MQNRIKELRKDILQFSQEDFAKSININRSTLAGIETGIIIVTDRVIRDICNTFDINEDWLRNGYGEIFSKDAKEKPSRYFKNYEVRMFEEIIIKQLSYLDRDALEKVLKFIESIKNNKTSIKSN